jgi:hypothetical protein
MAFVGHDKGPVLFQRLLSVLARKHGPTLRAACEQGPGRPGTNEPTQRPTLLDAGCSYFRQQKPDAWLGELPRGLNTGGVGQKWGFQRLERCRL